MRGVAKFFAVAILCVGAAHAEEVMSKWPEVVGVRPTPESLAKHHTDKFRIDSGFAVRRGSSFELTVTTNEVLAEGNMTIVMVNDDKPSRYFPEWHSKIKDKLGTKQYLLEVSMPVDSPVGKYENIEFVVAKLDKSGHWERALESYTYQYPFPIYVLFDAWNPKDEAVYVPDAEIIKDTLLNEYGKVFDGSLNSHRTIHWYYGHFYQVALDAVFHILEKADGKIMHDAYEVAKFIAHNVGVAEGTGGALTGNKDGVLRGRWETTFPGGKDPDDWVSTYDILKEWEKTGEPAKYGQCWVFAATQNTLLRAIGFASRQLSCFGARIDRSDKDDPNKVKHHIVREYYDDAAKLLYSEGSVWNYHSWNDVYINRKDKAYSGWQGIDGTPPGLGFAPLKAVYNQEDDYPWDTDQLISTTHSRVERFLIKCKDDPPAGEKRKSLDGCEVLKQLSVDKAGVQLMLSTAADASGEKDITKEYVDASRDAYIPEKPRPHYLPQQEEEEAPYVVHVEPQQPRLPVGQPVEALVSVQFKEPMDGAPALDVSVALDLVDRMGQIIKEVHLSEGKMLVDSEGRGELTLQISASEYVHVDLKEKFLELRAIVKDPVTGHVAMEKRTIPLDGPQLRVMAPPLVAASGDEEPEKHSIAVHLENPHPFPLDEVCVTIHTAASLQLHGDRTHCTSVGPNEFVTVTKHILAPEEEGTHTVTLTVAGSYLPSTIHHLPIVATEPRTGMAHYRN